MPLSESIPASPLVAQACATSGDAGIDSDKGIYINGGKVIASGNMLDHIAGGEQTYAVFSFASRQVGDSTYTLKNSDNKVIGEYAPTNDFTYLLVAGDELIAGDYTFWQGDTQLSASSMANMKGEAPQGEAPQMPENMTPPDNMQSERPERPEDMTGQQGERPEMPENMEDMSRPNHMGGLGMGNMINGAANSPTFTIVKGNNQFSNVSPVASTPTE